VRRYPVSDSTAAPIANGWSDPVPGRACHPAVDQRFSQRAAIACQQHLDWDVNYMVAVTSMQLLNPHED
jgi:hypothetical protein